MNEVIKPRVRLVVMGSSIAYGVFYAGYIGTKLVGYWYGNREPIMHATANTVRRAA
jgi:hypothetical protein